MSLDPSYSGLPPRAARSADLADHEPAERGAIARARVRIGGKVAAAMEADPAAKARLVDAIRIAGIQAAKRTADLVPLRPPVAIELAAVDAAVDGAVLGLRAEVRGVARTGLETEALAAAAVAALTAYDLWKSIDLGIVIEAVYLEEKWGGRSGPYRRQDEV